MIAPWKKGLNSVVEHRIGIRGSGGKGSTQMHGGTLKCGQGNVLGLEKMYRAYAEI